MSEQSTNSSKPGDALRKLAAKCRERAAKKRAAQGEPMEKAAQALVGATALVQLNNWIYG